MDTMANMMMQSALATKARWEALDRDIADEIEIHDSDYKIMEEIKNKGTRYSQVILDLVDTVSRETGVDAVQIVSKSRKRRPTRARQLVMYMARRHGITYEEIANALDRDHTTVVHNVRVERRRRGEE